MRNLTRIILLAIIVLAFFLRVVKLGELPPALTWDEVAWGYNAYALGLSGHDEFGKFFPHQYLESFGDFKPPMYAYLDILPIKMFGMNEFAVRLPSALAGVISVVLSYFLVKKIIPKNSFSLLKINFDPALLTAFLLAVSPWHILLSRAAFESNVATMFIILGVYLFLISLDKSRWYLLLSICSFVCSAYTFNSARIVAPILLLILFAAHYRYFIIRKEIVISGFAFGFLLSLPLLLFLRSPQAKLRYQEVNIFSNVGIIERVNQQHSNNNEALWSRVIQNRRFAYAAEYVKHYFDNLSPSFLFIKGDGNPKFSIQDVGQLYLWEIPFFVAGILFIFRKREGKWWIVPIWILIGIAPAATARETPHALRIASTLPMFQLLTAYGLIQITTQILANKKLLVSGMFLVLLTIAVSGNFVFFLHNYFFHYSREFSREWQYGYKEAIAYTESVKNKYDLIYFTEELGRPYIYLLFYGKYNPEYFQKNSVVEREALGFVNVRQVGNYIFVKNPGSIAEKSDGKNLIVDIPASVPEGSKIVHRIHALNDTTVFVMYEK